MSLTYSLSRSIIVLHSVSVFFALVATSLSIGDGGTFSIMLSPIFGTLTIAYHIISLTLIFTDDRPWEKSPLPIAFNVAAYILSLGWIVTFIVMAVILANRVTAINMFPYRFVLPTGMASSRKLQLLLNPLECALLLDLAIRSTVHRRRTGRPTRSLEMGVDPTKYDCWEAGSDGRVVHSLGTHILVTRTVRMECH